MVVLGLPRSLNLARFRFLCRSNPFLTPFQIGSCPFLLPFLAFLPLLTYHIQIHAISSLTIGMRRTIASLRDQWEVCILGEEMLGTSLSDISATAPGSKWSNSVMKVRALGAPHGKKKRRFNGPCERRERGGGGNTQSQTSAIARRSRGQQGQPPRGRGGTESTTGHDNGV